MRLKNFVITSITIFLVGISAAKADSCKSSSQLLQEKLDRYGMTEFPSLMNDCGLDGLISAFGGEIFGSINLPDFGNFCGYSAKDVSSWYGVDVPDSIGAGSSFNFGQVDASNLLDDSPLFEVNSNTRSEGLDLNY